jgi:hypothetical protein
MIMVQRTAAAVCLALVEVLYQPDQLVKPQPATVAVVVVVVPLMLAALELPGRCS